MFQYIMVILDIRVVLLTASLASCVASLGGSSIITERFICTMGTAGVFRSCERRVADWVATTYRCLFVSSIITTVRMQDISNHWWYWLTDDNDTKQTFISRNSFPMITFPPFEGLCEIDSRLLRFPLQIELVYATLGDHYIAAFAVVLNQQKIPCLSKSS